MINEFAEVTNLKKLFQYFNTEEKSREFLEQIRWEGTPACPKCGSIGVYKLKGGKRYQCKEKLCHTKFSVTTGTFLESSPIPLSTWIGGIFLFTSRKKGVSSVQMSEDLGITQKTAWFMLHRIRELMSDKSPILFEDLVEVDETYIKDGSQLINDPHPERGKQGRSLKGKTGVFGVASRTGQVRVMPVKDTKLETLKPIIEEWVKEGTLVITDEYNTYKHLKKSKYKHLTVNHGKKEWVRGNIHTNTIESFWSIVKRTFYGSYHYVSKKHLGKYCTEVAYRWNNNDKDGIGKFALALMRMTGRLTYEQLISKSETTDVISGNVELS